MLWNAFFVSALDADPYRAWSLAEQGVAAFAEARAPHHLSLVRTLAGFVQVELADVDGAERSCREALAVAERIGDGYATLNAWFYLAYALVERPSPERLAEAEDLATRVLNSSTSISYDLCSRWTLTKVAIERGQWAAAETMARAARALAHETPIYRLAITACLIEALTGLGRAEEAAALAQGDLEQLEQLGSAGFAEIPFRAAAAEASLRIGDQESARVGLKRAVREIELRASRIPDDGVRDAYLHRSRCNRRVFARWAGGAPPSDAP